MQDADAPWLIHGVSFKPWPACRHTHPTIDAVLALRDKVAPGDVQKIVVSTYRDAVAICDNANPRTPVETKFSLQHASAVVLMRGVPTLADFDSDAAADPAVAALRAKVELREEASFTQPYPAHFGASVLMERRDGSTVSHDIPDALGDPENPLSIEQIRGKARMLLTSANYSTAEADSVIAAALALADGGAVADLTRQLR